MCPLLLALVLWPALVFRPVLLVQDVLPALESRHLSRTTVVAWQSALALVALVQACPPARMPQDWCLALLLSGMMWCCLLLARLLLPHLVAAWLGKEAIRIIRDCHLVLVPELDLRAVTTSLLLPLWMS